MGRKLVLAALFLVFLYMGFWITIAPLAIGWVLIFWGQTTTETSDVVIGSIGLLGGCMIALFGTRFVASKWRV